MEKIVGYSKLSLFWQKLYQWLQVNFDYLFQNDQDLEQRISELEQANADLISRIEALESTDFTVDNGDSETYSDVF